MKIRPIAGAALAALLLFGGAAAPALADDLVPAPETPVVDAPTDPTDPITDVPVEEPPVVEPPVVEPPVEEPPVVEPPVEEPPVVDPPVVDPPVVDPPVEEPEEPALIVVPKPVWEQVDECGTENDRFVLNRFGGPRAAAYGVVTNFWDDLGYHTTIVQARAGYVFEDGTTRSVGTLPAFTDVACEVPPTEEPVEEEPVVVEPVVETPAPTETPAPVLALSSGTPTSAGLAHTGAEATPLLIAGGGGLLAGLVLVAAAVAKRRRDGHIGPQRQAAPRHRA